MVKGEEMLDVEAKDLRRGVWMGKYDHVQIQQEEKVLGQSVTLYVIKQLYLANRSFYYQ